MPAGADAAAIDQVVLNGVDRCESTAGLIALPILGPGFHEGDDGSMHQGGLYPGGADDLPPNQANRALAAASRVQPLGGLIGMVNIGFSNPTQAFGAFAHNRSSDPRTTTWPERNARIVLVNGSKGGADVNQIVYNPPATTNPYWDSVQSKVAAAGLTAAQVQVCWMVHATRGSEDYPGFPQGAFEFRDKLRRIAQILREQFPNVQLAYFSSREYQGYNQGSLDSQGMLECREPEAYGEGFGVKWVIEEQIKNSPALRFARSPILVWGPYYWGNSNLEPLDDPQWLPADFEECGTNVHPTEGGEQKIADELSEFLDNDLTTQAWWPKQSDTRLETVIATDDAYVDTKNCNVNFGLDPSLRISPTESTYLRFDVSAVNGTIVHAALGLRVDPGLAGSKSTHLDLVADTDWSEISITACNAPFSSGRIVDIPTPFSRGSYLNIDVTDEVLADSDGVLSFLISEDAELRAYLSKDTAVGALDFGPQLVLAVLE